MRAGTLFSKILIAIFVLWLAAAPGISPASAFAQGGGAGVEPGSQTQAEVDLTSSPPGAVQRALGDELTGGLEQLLEQLRAEEYFITWAEHTYLPDLPTGYQAPNRANGFRTYFTEDGFVIIPRMLPDGEALPWRWEAHLSGWGGAQGLPALLSEPLAVQQNRVEYRHGGLTEWYVNDESGLKQGFSIAAPPEDLVAGEPLRIELEIGGDLVAESQSGGSGWIFRDPETSQGLKLGISQAYDVKGNLLQVSLGLNDRILTLAIEDSQATYPLRIEMSITSIGETPYWGTGAWDYALGRDFRVATAGDVDDDGYSDILIGAPYFDSTYIDEGKVWIYNGWQGGVGHFLLFSKLSNQAGARFGSAISTAGDVNDDGYADIIVGAPYWDGGETDEGGAWIYHGEPGGVGEVPVRYLQGNQAEAAFGASVAFAGDVNGDGYSDVIIGASLYSGGQEDEGRAYVYHGSSSGIGASPAWQAESNSVEGLMGSSVSTAGDVNRDGYADVIVGASMFTNGQLQEGKAYVWHGADAGVNGGTNGTNSNAAWSFECNQSEARLGYSVSTAGDVNGDGYSDVIVAAPYYTDGETGEGAAWIFHGSSSGVNTTWDNMDAGNQISAHFGMSVAMAGDVNGDGYGDVIVGAPDYTLTESEEGRAFVWYGHSGGISSTRDWDGEGGAANVHYGHTVATAGDVNGDGYSEIFIAAQGDSGAPGGLYIYKGGPDGTEEEASWPKVSNLEEAQFGFSVSTAGDVNGDGYADIIVGAPYYDAGQPMEGRVYVYRGSENGLVSGPYWDKQADRANTWFGWSVASAGDVNNDGYDDVLVGTPYWEEGAGEEDEGGAWIYSGSSTGPVDVPFWHKEPDRAGAHFGWSVAGAGDVNGDGYADVIIGAPEYTADFTNEGMVFVYHGLATAVSSIPGWSYKGGETNAALGTSVASAGDVNRDGLSDVIVGAPKWDDSDANEGRAWVFHGTSLGLRTTASWHAEANSFNAQLGFSVSGAGDVNGDGFSDVIVGGPYYSDGQDSEGRVWVFHGSADGVENAHAWSKQSNETGAQYGYDVSSAGDVNGDSYADIVLGAPMMNDTITDEGTARVYLGSSTGLGATPAWRGSGGETLSWYGEAVSGAGDVNGDGYSEVIIGTPQYGSLANPPVNEGRVQVYYGGGGIGVSFNPRQRNDDDTPLAHLGRTKTDRPEVCLLMKSPFWLGELGIQQNSYPLNRRLDDNRLSSFSSSMQPYATNQCMGLFVDYGMVYHWKTRVLYGKVTHPYMNASRWVSLPYHGWNEADFRVVGSRLYLPLVVR